jgi:hypothetical protein
MTKIFYICSHCDKRKHRSKEEARYCQLWHQENLETEELCEYMELMDYLIEERGFESPENTLVLWDPSLQEFYSIPKPQLW